MIYSICLVGAFVIWHTLYRFRTVGRARLPRGRKRRPGCVIVCNHLAATDPVFVYLARFSWPRPIVLAKAELFAVTPLLSWFLRQLGAVPVRRGQGDGALLQRVVEQVRAGRDVLVFPEGTRSKTGQLQPLKSGAFVVAAAAGAPVVPCRILYQDGRPRLWRRVRVAFGQPLSAQQLGLAGGTGTPTPAALRAAKAQCVQALQHLYEENRPRMGAGSARGEGE